MDAALFVSIAGVLVSGGLAVVALIYARHADRRAGSAENAAVRAEQRELAAVRVASLERMIHSVHELAHATAEALAGDVSGFAKAERHRARLRAALNASALSLPNCERVLAGAGAFGSEFADALAELEGLIARERAHVSDANIEA